MKKTLIYGLLLILSNCCFAQSKDSLITYIDEHIDEFDLYTNFHSIQIKAINPKDFDPNDKYNFENSTFNSSTQNKNIKPYFDSLQVYQEFFPPYTLIQLDYNSYDLTQRLGLDSFYFSDNPDEEPEFKPIKITFMDNSTMEVKEYYDPSLAYQYNNIDDELKSFLDEIRSPAEVSLINSPKPIHTITYKIISFSSKNKTYPLNEKGDFVETPYGKVYLDDIQSNEVLLRFPKVISDNINVRAKYNDGQFLRSIGENSNIYFSPEVKNYFSELKQVFKKAKKLIINNKLKTKEEVDFYISENKPNIKEEIPYVVKGVQYTGPVKSLEITIKDTLVQQKEHTVYYLVKPSYDHGKLGDDYYIATDFKTSKKGIINKLGQWIIKPNYTDSFRKLNKFFYRDQLDYGYRDSRNYDNLHRFDYNNKKLLKVNYKLDELEIYNDNYVIIENKVNGPTGVVNAKTGEIIIPMIHRSIKSKGDFWIAENITLGTEQDLYHKDDRLGLYNKKGELVLDFEYDEIEIKDNFIYTKKEVENKTIADVYNSTLKNLTKGKYKKIIGYFNEGLLLLKEETISEENYSYNYFFIDENGDTALSFYSKDYHEVWEFTNGLARVEKKNDDQYLYDGDYGFIDSKGNVIIPFIYKNATDFLGRYAYVEYKKNGEQWRGFIDKNNKRVLELESSYQSAWYDEEIKKYKLKTWDEKIYDFDGKEYNPK